jgi:hypothetical protein
MPVALREMTRGTAMILRTNATLYDFRGIGGQVVDNHPRGRGHELYRFAVTLGALLHTVLTRGSPSTAMDVGEGDDENHCGLSLMVAFILSGLPVRPS